MSGSPRKRNKARAERSAFEVLNDREVAIVDDGGPRDVSVEEALIRRTWNDAMGGDGKAQRKVLAWIEEAEGRQRARATKRDAPRVSRRISDDPRNIDDVLLMLGIAAPDPSHGGASSHLLLKPSVVQAALSRRHGGTALSEPQTATIRRSTKDAGSLRWSVKTDD